ncbi:hypothetical protein [Methylovirgula sp. 4M-Z18]|uniref:hypothetical protein n=1 Tax=Methylovirgula sp. 4M-Z18 TaxID=2293567 RepID=UPI0030D0D175
MKKTTASATTVPFAVPEEPTQAQRFRQARTARSTALIEDYVELIADLIAASGEARATEIAGRLGVTHPTALKSIARLKREGLITSRPYRGIFLTQAGHELADLQAFRAFLENRKRCEIKNCVSKSPIVDPARRQAQPHEISGEHTASWRQTRNSSPFSPNICDNARIAAVLRPDNYMFKLRNSNSLN